MSERETLLRDIDAFLRQQRMAETRFGLAAVNDGHLIRRLRAGGNLTLRTVERVRAFMHAHPPPAAQYEQQEAA
jgi:hypothetical protein